MYCNNKYKNLYRINMWNTKITLYRKREIDK